MRCREGGYDRRLGLNTDRCIKISNCHDIMDIFTVSAHMRQRWRIIKSVVIILHCSLSVGYFSPGVFFSSSSHCTNAVVESLYY